MELPPVLLDSCTMLRFWSFGLKKWSGTLKELYAINVTIHKPNQSPTKTN